MDQCCSGLCQRLAEPDERTWPVRCEIALDIPPTAVRVLGAGSADTTDGIIGGGFVSFDAWQPEGSGAIKLPHHELVRPIWTTHSEGTTVCAPLEAPLEQNAWIRGVVTTAEGSDFDGVILSGCGYNQYAEYQVDKAEVLPDSPAVGVGLAAGDQILTVDGVSAHGMTHVEFARLGAGPEGTAVDLDIARGHGRFQATVVRQALPPP